MSIDVLKNDLKSGNVRALYLFYGPEEYLKKYYLDSIEEKVLDAGMSELNKIVLDGKVDTGRVMEYCEAMPVFSRKKLIIVKNSGLFKAKKKAGEAATGDKAHDNGFTAYLQNVPEYTCLIFLETEIDKRIKLVDAIKKYGLVVEFPLQKPAELVKWVTKVFRSYKKEIDAAAASRLVDNTELSMNDILNDINKLVLYTGDRAKVTIDDIEQVCIKSIKSRIFDLTDAIAEKNSTKALKTLNDMITMKEPIPKILVMIARQFRLVLEMKLMRSMGTSRDEAASKLGLTPYAAGKILKQVDSFTVEQLKDALREGLELDMAIKTGRINDRVAAELLIAKFSMN